MRKTLRVIYNLFVFLLIAAIIFLNYKLYHIPEYVKEQGAILNKETLDQLQFLKQEMEGEAAKEMQALYPEGFVFTNALYGLSWCAFGKTVHQGSDLRANALSEAHYALKQIYSKEGRAYFNEGLEPSHGIFYAGWANYLHAEIIALEGTDDVDPVFEDRFLRNSKTIAAAFNQNEAVFLPSYAGAAWPADNVIAMASLKLYAELYGDKYEEVITSWLDRLKNRLDPATGLIPHDANPRNTIPRGSSQSLMLLHLPLLDEKFALDQFKRYREHFLDYRFGLPGIREYAKGNAGKEDFDSGPIVLDIGGAASVVGIGCMTVFGERDLAKGLNNAVEAFAFSITENGKKRYLNGRLPILDAFITFANTRKASFAMERETYDFQLGRLRFHGWSIILILALLLSKRFLRWFGARLDKRYEKKKAAAPPSSK